MEGVKPSPQMQEAAAKANELRNTAARCGLSREQWAVVMRFAKGAKARCENKAKREHKWYGGRGIQFKFGTPTECAQYIAKALGPRPTPKHSIDRVNNDGHYEKGNLRWATKQEQIDNRRDYKGWPRRGT